MRGGTRWVLATFICGALTNATGHNLRAMQNKSSRRAGCVSLGAECSLALLPTEHTSRQRELQACLAQRMFLSSEENHDVDSESTAITSDMRGVLLGFVHAARG